MSYAIRDARAGRCDLALEESLVTQCHNGAAQRTIESAGSDRVCQYLRDKTPLRSFEPVLKAGDPTPAFDADGKPLD
jgi:hypothetical protein